MKVSARLKNLRIAPRKVRLTSNLIKGMDASLALDQLNAIIKRSNPYFIKLLSSAINNGENNFGLDKSNLYIDDVVVNAGPTLKRSMPKAFGRAGAIRKRTSQIEIILAEKVEGKGRKSKEEMERIKAEREKEKNVKSVESTETDKEKQDKPQIEKTKSKPVDGTEKVKKTSSKASLTSRIFQRKSM